MIPLYGFLEGDTIGLLIMASEFDTVISLAEKLLKSAKIRVTPYYPFHVFHNEQILSPHLLLEQTSLQPLERFDVRRVRNFDGF